MKQTTPSRILAAWLCTLLVVPGILSCGDSADKPQSDATDAVTEAVVTTEAPDPRLSVSDDLPERDWGGDTFMILTHSETYYCVEEENGDILNDVYFKRQSLVEERFNVDIKAYNAGGISENVSLLTNSVLAGDDEYDLAVIHSITGGPTLITEHILLDWNNIEGINLTKPWWNQQINETLNIAERQYYIAGYISNPSPFCMFYNPFLAAQFDFEDIYTVVNEGRWTLDYLMQLADEVTADLNGDGKMEYTADRYGIGFNNDNETLNFMYGSNMVSVLIGEDGQPIPNVNNDKMQVLVDKVWSLANEKDRSIFVSYNDEGLTDTAFREGRSLILTGGINIAINLRDAEIDFAVIPYPKYDEAQEGYYTHVDAWNGILCVGKSVKDTERVGIITEAYAAETWKHVIPVFYEKALSDKYFRDEQSIAMMNLIYDGILYDFGYVFDNWLGTTWTLPRIAQSKNTNLASYWAKIEKKVTKHYQKLYDAVLEDE
ncbi:MAG: hypothetical protein IJ302_00610 [Clostridia bacterium]|nr:hypothetical protein [Clostridia bacterium]